MIIGLLTYLPSDLLTWAVFWYRFHLKMLVQKLECSPLKKVRKNFSVDNPYTQLFDISTIKAIDLCKNKTLKNNKFKTCRTMSAPKHILLNIIYEFVATMNVYLNAKKSSSYFNCVLHSHDRLF